MGNKSKKKGTNFERFIAKEFSNKLGGEWRRIPLSGSAGTVLNIQYLSGDVQGKLDWIPLKFTLECKAGYGGSKQITLKRDWILQAKREAADNSIPALVLKFSGAKTSNIVVCFELEDFIDMMNRIKEFCNDCES